MRADLHLNSGAGREPEAAASVQGVNSPQLMPTQHAIEIFGLINCTIIGLTLLFHPLAWGAFFAWLRSQGTAGALAYGSICLSFGSIVVAFHRVWHGLLLLLTLAGWFDVILGTICLLIPSAGLGLMELPERSPGVCRLAGLACLVVAAVILAALVIGGGL